MTNTRDGFEGIDLTTLDTVSNNPNSSNRIVVRHKSGLTQMLPMSVLPYLKQQPETETVTFMQWFGGYYKDPKDFFANFASDPETLFKVFREEFGTSGVTDVSVRFTGPRSIWSNDRVAEPRAVNDVE